MTPEDIIAQVGTVVAGLLMASQLPAMYGVVAKRAGSDITAMSAAPSKVASALPVVKPKFMKAMAFGNLAGGKLSASKE
jgi:hypothetical protein